MSDFPLPQLKSYLPTTFAERGVLVPFTTPQLAGARIRFAEGGAEVMLPKLSTGTGLYVFPCRDIGRLCRMTVHDRRLNKRLEKLTSITPSTLRVTARSVALEGLAGREAQAAAAVASRSDERSQALSHFLLLLALWAEVEPGNVAPTEFSAPSPALRDAALRAVTAQAGRLGLAGDTLAMSLREAGAAFSGVGIQGKQHSSHLLTLLKMLTGLQAEVAAWSRTRPNEGGELGGMIAEVAAATLTCAVAATREARLATADPAALMQQWHANRTTLKDLAERPDWLLDGWEQICQIWQAAGTDAEKVAALDEIASLVPVLPKETGKWVRLTIRAQSLFTYRDTVLVREDWRIPGDSPSGPQGRRTVLKNEDWRTGSPVDVIERAEHMRALSA